MKNIRIIIQTIAIVLISTLIGVSPVMAQESPYEEHPPVDTGFETSAFYVLSGASFASGFAVLNTVQSIKKKINQS